MTSPLPDGRSVPGALQLTIKGTDAGQPFAIVLGAGGDSPSTADMGAVGAQWLLTAWDNFRYVCADSVTCTGATLRFAQPESLPYEIPAPASPNGTIAGTRAIAAASTLIKWQTAVGGRSGRGRTFLPGLVQGFVSADGRSYTAAHRTQVNTNAVNYIGGAMWAQRGLYPAVLSFRRGEAFRITAGSLAAVVGVQRRRMRA